MKLKKCNKCNIEFPENKLFFHLDGIDTKNETRYHNSCRSCRCKNVINGEQFNKDTVNDKNELYCIKCKEYFSKDLFGIKNENINR